MKRLALIVLVLLALWPVGIRAAPVQQEECDPLPLSFPNPIPTSTTGDGWWERVTSVTQIGNVTVVSATLSSYENSQYLGVATQLGSILDVIAAPTITQGNYKLWIKVENVVIATTVDSYTSLACLTDQQTTTNGTYSCTYTNVSNLTSADDFVVKVTTPNSGGVDTASLSGQWSLVLLPATCGDPFVEPTPTATTTPPVVQQPACAGVEALDASVTLNYGETWSNIVETTYNDFWVRYAFYEGVGTSAQLSVGDYTSDDVPIRDASFDGYDDQFYMRTLPQTFGGMDADLSVTNQGKYPVTLVSACVMEARAVAGECENTDPDLDDPFSWPDSNGMWFNSYISLSALQQLHRELSLAPGTYYMDVTACVDPEIHVAQTLLIGGNAYDVTPCDGTTFPVRHTFTVASTTNNDMPVIQSYETNYRNIYVDRVCINPHVSTPTPTPPPGETPPPDMTLCINPDPDFYVPLGYAWISLGNVEWENHHMHMQPGSLIYKTTTIKAGYYNVYFTARSSSANTLRISENDSNTGDTFTLYGDNQYHQYPVFKMYLSDYPTLIVSMPDSNHDIVSMWRLCVMSPSPTPTPNPTATPAPTQTPGGATATATTAPTSTPNPSLTPTPGPGPGNNDASVCVNDDPGIDSLTYWSVGNGTIEGSVATLNAGGALFENVPQATDGSWTYYVTVKAKSLLDTELTLDFRNNLQGTTVEGGDMWRKVTFVIPAVSSRGAKTVADSNTFPELFTDELPRTSKRSEPLWSLSPLYYLSPLRVPESPDVVTNETLLYITALAGNTTQIEIDSVCVSVHYPGDSPVDPGTPVQFWMPVCDRDYVIQAGYSEAVPIIHIGDGSRAGMPVHAIQDGQISDYGNATGYYFGDRQYTGCVVIDHVTLNMSVQSYYCGLEQFRISQSGLVKRGDVIGYAGTLDWQLDYEENQIVVAVKVEGNWIDPDLLFSDYPECYPYYVVLKKVEECSASGSGFIPSPGNPSPPLSLDIGEWLRWLVDRLYDTLIYPLLCALVIVYNRLVSFLTSAINALIEIFTPAWIFFYRVEKIVSYLLDKVGEIVAMLKDILIGMWDLIGCVRTIIQYFIGAFSTAITAEYEIESLAPGNLATNALGIILLLMDNTIAEAILTPIAFVGCAYMAWQLFFWGIAMIKRSLGAT